MGKKINPKVFRLVTTTSHSSKWFANKQDFKKMLHEDIKVRKYIKNKIEDGGISKITIDRFTGQIKINIHTSKPGVIIGRGGVGIEDLKKEVKRKFFGNQKIQVQINVQEVEKPDLDAEIVMQQMIAQIEKRVPFRRVMKRAVEQVNRAGGKGVKIMLAGRLNGAEIARTETLVDGKMPLSTLRADIDYTRGAARTIYGAIGLKVWIYKGTVFKKDQEKQAKKSNHRNNRRRPAPKKAGKPVNKKVKK